MVVDVSRRTRNDDFGLVETGQIRDANELFRIAAGDAGDRDVLQPGGATGRDHAPLGPGQLGETAADRVRELVDLNEVFRCGIHRRADFRPLHRSADDGESPAAIDDRLDAKRLIDLRSSHQWSGSRRGLERRVKPAEQGRHRKGIAHQEQFPPCEPSHFRVPIVVLALLLPFSTFTSATSRTSEICSRPGIDVLAHRLPLDGRKRRNRRTRREQLREVLRVNAVHSRKVVDVVEVDVRCDHVGEASALPPPGHRAGSASSGGPAPRRSRHRCPAPCRVPA